MVVVARGQLGRGRPRKGFYGSYKKKPKTAKAIAVKALKLAIKNQPERKYLDVTMNHDGSSNIITWDGIGTALPGFITQGIQDNAQRVGDQISLISLTARGHIQMQDIQDSVLLMVVWDPDNVLSSLNQMNSTAGTGYAPLGYKPWDYRQNFKVLYEKRYNLNMADSGVSTTNGASVRYPIDFHIPLSGKKTQYLAAGTTVNAGQLSVVLFGSQNGGAMAINYPYARLSYRLVYQDA